MGFKGVFISRRHFFIRRTRGNANTDINTGVLITLSFVLNIPTDALDATELKLAVTAPGENVVSTSSKGNVTSVPAEEVDGDPGNSMSTKFN